MKTPSDQLAAVAGDLVLSGYPLTSGFKQRLAGLLNGSVTYLNLSQLRLGGPLRAVSLIRSIRAGRCIIAIEEPSGYTLFPLLHILAMATRARAIEVIAPSFARRRLSRFGAVRSAAGVPYV